MVTREGQQRFESRTNQNLFLSASDFDEHGTYSMGRFLLGNEACRVCHRESWCPLLFADVDASGWKVWGTVSKESPQWDACPGWGCLRDLLEWRTQRLFFDAYCALYGDLVQGFDEAVREHVEEGGEGLRSAESVALKTRLSFPALIPEVWLNVIGRNRTREDEEHLEENPQRVDFVMLAEGRKCVIEIDGPSHYAQYDKTLDMYVADERQYTKNLRIERSLRRQEWEIFRFSNLEVESAVNEDRFLELILDLPFGKFSTSISAEHVKVADDIFF
jgi:hypothetical protein